MLRAIYSASQCSVCLPSFQVELEEALHAWTKSYWAHMSEISTQQQQETNSNADADAIAEQWARYYEANPEEAIKNGYTKQHYDQYLMQKQKT